LLLNQKLLFEKKNTLDSAFGIQANWNLQVMAESNFDDHVKDQELLQVRTCNFDC
jgi:hypothetical protein